MRLIPTKVPDMPDNLLGILLIVARRLFGFGCHGIGSSPITKRDPSTKDESIEWLTAINNKSGTVEFLLGKIA